MSSEVWLNLMRGAWITLCSMMLISRFAFQGAGAIRMRSFLNRWKVSQTHRIWGIGAVCIGLFLLVTGIPHLPVLNILDIILGLMAILVLVGDGSLNLAPSGFSQFKEKVQDIWVSRTKDTKREGDNALFGTVNFFLGLASILMAACVSLYRPIEAFVFIAALVLACGLTAILIAGCLSENIPMQNN